MQELIPEKLREEAATFAVVESKCDEPTLYGVADGKAVGTYLEHKFRSYLVEKYEFQTGNSASGIDFPSLNIDMKVTSIKQPQSSCPFKSARQKIFGLGYGLLIFVYKKYDDHNVRTGRLDIKHTIYVEKERTADFQVTRGIREILERDGNHQGSKNMGVWRLSDPLISSDASSRSFEEARPRFSASDYHRTNLWRWRVPSSRYEHLPRSR